VSKLLRTFVMRLVAMGVIFCWRSSFVSSGLMSISSAA